MKRAHKIKLNPTPEQIESLTLNCDVARFAYNWGLARWNEQYRLHLELGSDKPHIFAIRKEFNAVKRDAFSWVIQANKHSYEWGFECLGVAWKNYFESIKGKRGGEKMGKPKFRSRFDDKQGFRAGVGVGDVRVNGHSMTIPKLKTPINMAEKLRYPDGEMKSVIISSYAGQWWASFLFDVPDREIKTAPGVIGVDLGIKTLAVLSDGTEYQNPKRYRTLEKKLVRLQRSLSRKKKGSKNREKAKEKVVQLHYKISCQRSDAVHKMTSEVAVKGEVVALEDLNVKGMVKNRSLAKSVSDASFGEIRRQLSYKAKDVVFVDRFFPSSKMCHNCGKINGDIKDLSIRHWVCPSCGSEHDRDINAAINIKNEAVRLNGFSNGRRSSHLETLNGSGQCVSPHS